MTHLYPTLMKLKLNNYDDEEEDDADDDDDDDDDESNPIIDYIVL